MFITNGAKNENFSPIFGTSFLIIIILLSYITKSLRKDMVFLHFLVIALFFQIAGFYLHGGVVDYINLGLFITNIPDLIIFFTLLTLFLDKAKSTTTI